MTKTIAQRAFCFFGIVILLTATIGLNAQTPPKPIDFPVVVRDMTMQPVEGVSVQILSRNGGYNRAGVTNTKGEYEFSDLPCGEYDLIVDGARLGLEKKEIRLNPCWRTSSNARNITLTAKEDPLPKSEELPQLKDEIDISDKFPVILNEAGTAMTIPSHTFHSLPGMPGNLSLYLFLMPGINPVRPRPDNPSPLTFNGQRTHANMFMIDGVSANFGVTGLFAPGQGFSGTLPATSVFGGYTNLVTSNSLDAEAGKFRISAASSQVNSGRLPGAQIWIETKSGTNEYHGEISNAFRHEALAANDWFANSLNEPKTGDRLNYFGGTFGGPVPLHWLRLPKTKDHDLRFFFAVEGLQLRELKTAKAIVPSQATRASLSNMFRPYLTTFPLATFERDNVALFSARISNPAHLITESLRLDYSWGSKLALFARQNFSSSGISLRGGSDQVELLTTGMRFRASADDPTTGVAGIVSVPQVNYSPLTLNNLVKREGTTDTLTVGATFQLPNFGVHEVRLNRSVASLRTRYTLDDFGGAIPVTDEQVFPTGYNSQTGLFALALRGLSSSTLNSPWFLLGQGTAQKQSQFVVSDNVIFGRGPNPLQFGGDYRSLAPRADAASYNALAYAPATSASDKQRYDINRLIPVSARFHSFSLWGQATRLISSDFTLTFGVRWDIAPIPQTLK